MGNKRSTDNFLYLLETFFFHDLLFPILTLILDPVNSEQVGQFDFQQQTLFTLSSFP